MQFEATGDKEWLNTAELSFRASLSMEGKPIKGGAPPDQLLKQQWWQKTTSTQPAPVPPSAPRNKTAGGKASATPVGNKPTTSRLACNAARKPPNAPVKTTSVQPQNKQALSSKLAVGRGRGGPRTVNKGLVGRGASTPATNKPGTATQAKPETAKQAKPEAAKQAKSGAATQTKPVATVATPTKPPSPQPQLAEADLNQSSYLPRLGLARVLGKATKPSPECVALYNEVIKQSPGTHDAYIELGELLASTSPLDAVDVYCKFPFTETPSFDDAYLHGEIVRLLMSKESYDDPRLATSMVAMGRALGIAVLDKKVAVLEAKFKTGLLKKVYAGVHQKEIDDPGLVAFFKFKCWT